MATQVELVREIGIWNDGSCAEDLNVVNGARVSFNAMKEDFDDKDAGLINFLMRERHGTPFEHGYFRFIVEAPIFVAREHMRHRVGHSYNEMSGRYTTYEPRFYVPTFHRTQKGKPGDYRFEEIESVAIREEIERTMGELCQNAWDEYETMVEDGVAKEEARMILPVCTMTKYVWSCNPRSLMHFLALRAHPQAMHEIRQLAEDAEAVFKLYMPVTHKAFEMNGRVAP